MTNAPDTFTIVIPWPHKFNDPNARPPHWAAKAKHVAAARTLACLTCKQQTGHARGWVTAMCRVRAHHKTARFRDSQNIIATLKATIDGVEDAGVIADDVGLGWYPVERCKDAANPRIELEFTGKK